MNKVSDVLSERFSQDPLETYFCKQHPPGAWQDKLPSYDSGCAKNFHLHFCKKFSKPITAGKVRDEKINFESDRTSLMSEKMQVSK